MQLLLPQILGPDDSFRLHSHQGKRDLQHRLPARLAGYASWGDEEGAGDTAICILVDRDSDDCHQLKVALTQMATDAGIPALVRIAIEELEAWFFGDRTALEQAYPGVETWLSTKPQFNNPDAIQGGTAEQLGRAMRRAGYHRGGLAKMAAAEQIAVCMDVNSNTSHSFQVFRDGLRTKLMPIKP